MKSETCLWNGKHSKIIIIREITTCIHLIYFIIKYTIIFLGCINSQF